MSRSRPIAVRLVAWTSSAILTLALLTGCVLTRACTMKGAFTGVSFDIGEAVPATATGLDVHACVDDECVDESGPSAASTWVFVRLRGVNSERVATARLTLRTNEGAVFDATTPVTLRRHQPNGPGCAPTVYQSTVRATSTGTLVAA